MSNLTALERAFFLARTGDYVAVSGIRDQLKAEGYNLAQLEGRSLNKQLRQLCADAQKVVDT